MRILALFLLAGLAWGQSLPNAVPTPTPIMQFLDASGRPLIGAKLCTYAAGTSTPQATYTSYTAGTPNTNPVIADAGGRVQVWIGALSYKFVLRNGGGATSCSDGDIVWTADHVQDTALYFVNYVQTVGTATLISYTNPLTGGVSRTVSNRLAEDNYVKDFGAVCDGSTDDHADIQQALNSVIADNGGRVNLPIGVCNIGSVGVSIPNSSVSGPGVIVRGQGRYASSLKYTGSTAAFKIGITGSFTYRNSLEQFSVDITTAGVNAIGINMITCLYCNFVQMGVISEFDRATSRQVGLQLTGGEVADNTFGAYFKWDASEVRGSFYRGVYFAGENLGWGYNSCQFLGGGIISTGSVVANTIGLWLHQGNQNMFINTDAENWSTAVRSDAYDNSFSGFRTEGSTLGLNMTAASIPCCPNPTDTTGGSFNRVFSSDFPNGITDNSGGTSQIWGTDNGGNFENHLTNQVYLDSTLQIPGNTAIKWLLGGGGSSGIYWGDFGDPLSTYISTDSGGILHIGAEGQEYLQISKAQTFSGGLQIPVGIWRNSAGLQHFTIPAASVCSTAASVGAICNQPITYNTAFADANYTPVCFISTVGTGVPVALASAFTSTTINVRVAALTAAAANGSISCIAIHW